MDKQWYNKKWIIVLLHIAAWTVFFFLPYFFRPNIEPVGTWPIHRFFNWDNILRYAILVAVFYFNAFWLIPRLLNRRRYVAYALAIVLILVADGCYHMLFSPRPVMHRRTEHIMKRDAPRDPPPNRMMVASFRGPMFPAFFTLIFVLAMSNAYRFFLDKLRADKMQQERETERLKSELGFLRSQISPHFIFNVLNSAVSLARTAPQQVEPTLIKLSGLMRYMLYDTEDTKVPLNQEVEYLDAYIELQQLRFGVVEIAFVKQGSFFGYSIEPMLLIPFVENAFKHGLTRVDNPFISIILEENNRSLMLEVKNRFNPDRSVPKDKYSGIGLANVRKRLEILYGDQHQLSVDVTNGLYTIKLLIPL